MRRFSKNQAVLIKEKVQIIDRRAAVTSNSWQILLYYIKLYSHCKLHYLFLSMIPLHSLILFLLFKFYGLANYGETRTATCDRIIIKIWFNVTLFLSKTNKIILINAPRILSNNKRDFRCNQSLWRKLVIGVSIWDRCLCYNNTSH